MKVMLMMFIISTSVLAQPNGLTPADQKYYKNEYGTGMNQLERIDSTVKEINKLHGDIAALKAEVQTLRKEVEELKKGK